ncbi:MAG: hypothetical protein CL610_28950 [Anaerolineaceae bacterium]|nr:hypothetical protein [Anaerolineaceae bacterium]
MNNPIPLPPSLQVGQWQPVDQGLSGAVVLRGNLQGQACYLKITPHTHRMPVRAEHERLRWLQGRVPVPPVILYMEDQTHQFLVTAAITGVEAMAYEAEPHVRIRQLARAIRQLHDLPVANCPFRWTIDEQIAFARKTVEMQAVNVDLLDDEFRHRTPDDLLQELIALRPGYWDPVVVHGDAYSENILLEPATGRVAAFLDVGHSGVADRYTDFAMIHDDLISTYGEPGWQAFLHEYGHTGPDPQRLRFYRLFNEFL